MTRAICPNCGEESASARELTKYNYKESGLSNVWLHGGVTETECSACGKKSIRIRREPQLLQVIAMDLLMEARFRTGSELRFLRRACGLSQAQLASLLGYRRETIAEREAKENPGLPFPEEVGVRWVLLRTFCDHLSTPGNRALGESAFKKLWKFSGFFHDFAKSVDRRIDARVRGNRWAVDSKEDKAA